MSAPVLIVGAGPVGLTLALLLHRYGVKARVLEKQPAPYPLPRAVHFDGEAMRVFQAAGVADALGPETHVSPGMLFKSSDGRVLIDWSRDQQIGETGWYESYRCHQPGVERVLREACAAAGLTITEGAEVTAVHQTDAGASMTLDTGEVLACDYLVGCDGANSFVRASLGIELDDLGFEEPWLVVDANLKHPWPDLGDYSVQYCDPDAPATYVRGVGDRRRWEIRLSSDAKPTEAGVWRYLSRWITPDDAVLERFAVYTFRSVVAQRWADGRVFLAGDAAHQMPPFMGQGMCCGIRDAANLAWKLAQVLQGGTDVLDTYETERAPHIRAFIELSVNLGRLINSTGQGDLPEGQMKSIWPALGPGLGPRDDVAGRLAPQIIVDGARSDDLCGPWHYALTQGADVPGMRNLIDDSGWLAARDLQAIVVRPDGYALKTIG
ncbi:MAG: bifunctional 3-(3-hydroxy-phenyl)propionate/3-hydroxycinnamic acid hydroxylase [Pseudomonadota bacterium]